jgi:glycosyltransferase involved in cell wall biosynthesis
MSAPVTRLVIDCQVLQTLAFERGMGKYATSLLQEVQKLSLPYSEVVLLFNSSLDYSDKLAAMVKGLHHARPSFVKLKKPGLQTVLDIRDDNVSRLDTLLSRSKGETDFLILSLFLDSAAPGACPVFPTVSRRNLVLFYDIIELIYHERFLTEDPHRENYLAQYRTLFEADLIFTISQTVADDLAIYVGIPPEKMVNIDGAPVKRAHLEEKRPNLPLPEKFILMPSGEPRHKNNARAVQAFDSFLERTGLDYTLVLTSYFNDDTRRSLSELSDKLLFAGNVAEAELVWLYRHAKLVLFASEYEGLGLPVLEAAESGKPIACSDIPVFNEISPSAFFYFDPYDTPAISEAIEMSLKDHDSFKRMKGEYPAILERYSWAQTARKFLDGLEKLGSLPVRPAHRPRLAVITPNPASKNVIGRLVQELHPALHALAEVDYYYEGPEHELARYRPDYLQYAAPTSKARYFNARRYAQYDAVIYHVADSEYHMETLMRALYLPGLVVLHTTKLDSLFAGMQRLGLMSASRVAAEQRLQELLGGASSSCIASLVNGALCTLVNTPDAAASVAEVNRAGGRCEVGALAAATPALGKRSFEQKRRLAVGLFNVASARKGSELTDALTSLPEADSIQVVGIEAEFSGGGKEDASRVRDGLTDFERQQKIGKLDVLIDCSERTAGEMPQAVLEAMRYGVACVVNPRQGWAAELPDEAVLKLADESGRLQAAERLVRGHALRNALGNAARAYTRARHGHPQYAATMAGLALQPPASSRLAIAEEIKRR